MEGVRGRYREEKKGNKKGNKVEGVESRRKGKGRRIQLREKGGRREKGKREEMGIK